MTDEPSPESPFCDELGVVAVGGGTMVTSSLSAGHRVAHPITTRPNPMMERRLNGVIATVLVARRSKFDHGAKVLSSREFSAGGLTPKCGHIFKIFLSEKPFLSAELTQPKESSPDSNWIARNGRDFFVGRDG